MLKLTDEVGFSATGAAWVHDRDSNRWHYLLVTPMIDSKGPRWVYERLLKVFAKLPLPPGITPLDITIASPREEFFRQFPVKTLASESFGTAAHLRDHIFNGVFVDEMTLYRMVPMGNGAGDRARTFESKVNQLLAA